MRPYRCFVDGTHLIELETRNVFLKHGGCITCGAVYVLWGDKMTRCQTPTACISSPWNFRKLDNPAYGKIEPGPNSMGLL